MSREKGNLLTCSSPLYIIFHKPCFLTKGELCWKKTFRSKIASFYENPPFPFLFVFFYFTFCRGLSAIGNKGASKGDQYSF